LFVRQNTPPSKELLAMYDSKILATIWQIVILKVRENINNILGNLTKQRVTKSGKKHT
jgi:hypothetical protein